MLGVFIVLFIFILTFSLFIFEKNIKKEVKIGELDFVANSFISLIITFLNVFCHKTIIGVLNPISNKVHLLNKDLFNSISSESVIYKEQLVYTIQNKKLGWFKFIILYVINSRYGYSKNIFEKQAFYWKYKEIDKNAINEELDNKLEKYKGAC